MVALFAWVLVGVAVLVMAVAGALLARLGRSPELDKARLFLRFDELHRLHIVSMAVTWFILLAYLVSVLAIGAPPLFPHGAMAGLLAIWSLFMSVSVTLLVRRRVGAAGSG